MRAGKMDGAAPLCGACVLMGCRMRETDSLPLRPPIERPAFHAASHPWGIAESPPSIFLFWAPPGGRGLYVGKRNLMCKSGDMAPQIQGDTIPISGTSPKIRGHDLNSLWSSGSCPQYLMSPMKSGHVPGFAPPIVSPWTCLHVPRQHRAPSRRNAHDQRLPPAQRAAGFASRNAASTMSRLASRRIQKGEGDSL